MNKFLRSKDCSYYLREGYKRRGSYHHYDDRGLTDEYQDKVYSKARQVLEENNYSTVLDIGTGSGYKLVKYFEKEDTLGLELQQNIPFLEEKYPDRKWQLSEFEEKKEHNKELVICSDVIEHLVEPDDLLEFVHNIDFGHLVLSTPERLITRGEDHLGPPTNLAHTMEWSKDEFFNYISKNFLVLEHFTCNSKQGEEKQGCQIIVCKKKGG